MAKVQDIQVINIDNIPYAVDTMSETAQRLVSVYNEWNQQEADIRNELMIIQAAKETLSRQIIEQVRTEKTESAEKTEAPTATTATTATAPISGSESVDPTVAPEVVQPKVVQPADALRDVQPTINPNVPEIKPETILQEQ